MKKRKVIGGIVVLILLFLAVGGFFYLKSRGEVAQGDITFTIATKEGTELQFHMWHSWYDGEDYLFLPSCTEQTAHAYITASGLHLLSYDGGAAGLSVSDPDLSEGKHSLAAGGSTYAFTIMRSAKVPSLYIMTDSGSLTYIEEKKGNREPGLYKMVDADGSMIGEGKVSGLKSRGNATFLEDKKPYQMSLLDKADLFGGDTKIENYILLANRQDQSLLRNKILYDLAADIGLPYTPRSRYVDLYINAEYRGSYLLSEKAEVAKNRLPIKVSAKETETGFFAALEYTIRLDESEEAHFVTEGGQGVIIKKPEKPTGAQFDYIRGRFEEIENAIGDDSLETLAVNWESMAAKYLMEEFSKNLDAMYSSQNFYCESKSAKGGEFHEPGVLYAGPVWDYDKTLGNPLIEHNRTENFQEPWGIYAASKQANENWWHNLMESAFFQGKVRACMDEKFNGAVQRLLDHGFDDLTSELRTSASLDYIRWDPFEHGKYEEPFDFETDYEREVKMIRSFMEQRFLFLDKVLFGQVRYDELPLDPANGELYVKTLPALEGYPLHEPRDPKIGGKKLDHWVRTDTGETVEFNEPYDGVPFTLKAVYRDE